jgi:hypothetical protein
VPGDWHINYDFTEEQQMAVNILSMKLNPPTEATILNVDAD